MTSVLSEPDIVHEFNSRGIGLGNGPCFICGYERRQGVVDELAATVDPISVIIVGKTDESAGMPWHPILEMFYQAALLCRLDYRPNEPKWVQIKVNACGEHVPNLVLLDFLSGNQISMKVLKKVIPQRKLP